MSETDAWWLFGGEQRRKGSLASPLLFSQREAFVVVSSPWTSWGCFLGKGSRPFLLAASCPAPPWQNTQGHQERGATGSNWHNPDWGRVSKSFFASAGTTVLQDHLGSKRESPNCTAGMPNPASFTFLQTKPAFPHLAGTLLPLPQPAPPHSTWLPARVSSEQIAVEGASPPLLLQRVPRKAGHSLARWLLFLLHSQLVLLFTALPPCQATPPT